MFIAKEVHICKNLQEFYGKYAFFAYFLWLFRQK